MRVSALVITVFGVSVAGLATAADDAALRKCRDIRDGAARLACYDALPLATTPSAPAQSLFRPQTQPVPGAPAAASPAPAPAPPAQRAAAPGSGDRAALESQFGLQAKAGPELVTIQSYIPGRFEGWGPNYRIRLANGQVWQVVDDSKGVLQRQDPKVTVRRGLLGSFYLDFEGDNRSPRVKRIE